MRVPAARDPRVISTAHSPDTAPRPTRKEEFLCRQVSPSPHTPPAQAAAVVEDPASGTVDVEAGEKVSTVERGAAATRLEAVDLLRGLVMVRHG